MICDHCDYHLLFCLFLKLLFAEIGSDVGLFFFLLNGLTLFFGLSIACICAHAGFALHNVREVAHAVLGAVIGTTTRHQHRNILVS